MVLSLRRDFVQMTPPPCSCIVRRPQDFEFKGGGRRELKTLSVNKNKLWNLTLGCPEKAWNKQEVPFKTIVDSFLPRL